MCGLKPTPQFGSESVVKSHPSWVCGLKLAAIGDETAVIESHPSWVCGLKHLYQVIAQLGIGVTPFVGVWIETTLSFEFLSISLVTPFVGVWIETK